jgi:hypothetical protein
VNTAVGVGRRTICLWMLLLLLGTAACCYILGLNRKHWGSAALTKGCWCWKCDLGWIASNGYLIRGTKRGTGFTRRYALCPHRDLASASPTKEGSSTMNHATRDKDHVRVRFAYVKFDVWWPIGGTSGQVFAKPTIQNMHAE